MPRPDYGLWTGLWTGHEKARLAECEMAKASQQYSSPSSCWDAVSEEQDIGKEVVVVVE